MNTNHQREAGTASLGKNGICVAPVSGTSDAILRADDGTLRAPNMTGLDDLFGRIGFCVTSSGTCDALLRVGDGALRAPNVSPHKLGRCLVSDIPLVVLCLSV